MTFIKNNLKYILIISITLIAGFLIYIFTPETNANNLNETELVTTKEEICENKKIFVDVKGAVKNPGVYEMEENNKIIDAITKAGGLNKSASTDNLNLSKKLTDEMVIYVYTKTEIANMNKETKETTTTKPIINENIECNCEETTSKTNINTATYDELISITGIGASKATSIIKYREDNGYFTSIEDIKNVSGIGETIFEQIKNYITV